MISLIEHVLPIDSGYWEEIEIKPFGDNQIVHCDT